MSKKKIAPSILSADFSRLADEVKAVEQAGADLIHIDVMDGHFVPNLTVGPLVVEALRTVTDLPLDVHLMVSYADPLIPAFVKAGSNYLTVHLEACPHLHRTLQMIKESGARRGVALNPATPLSLIEHIVKEVDLLLLMSVNPGFGGQEFIPETLEKARAARRLIDEKGLSLELEMDGGIKVENAARIAGAGVDIFVAGSAIFGSGDYRKTIERMRQEIASVDRKRV